MTISTEKKIVSSNRHKITIRSYPSHSVLSDPKTFYCPLCDADHDIEMMSDHFFSDNLQLCTPCAEIYLSRLKDETFHLKLDEVVRLMQNYLFLKNIKQYGAADHQYYYFTAVHEKNKTWQYRISYLPNDYGCYDVYIKKSSEQGEWVWNECLDRNM